MLTIFKLWCTGYDLKCDTETWEEAFDKHSFSHCKRQLMQNANICYECLDSLDDFHAQMKKGSVTLPKWGSDENTLQELHQMADTSDDIISAENIAPAWENMLEAEPTGQKENAEKDVKAGMRRILTESGWTDVSLEMLPLDLNLTPEKVSVFKTPAQWKADVIAHRAQVLREHSQCQTSSLSNTKEHFKFTPDEVKIVNKEHLTSSFQSKQWQKCINQIAKKNHLNKEQECAYHIIVNHSCSDTPDQLKMNIAGMAGTGKTQVLLALQEFFSYKNKSHWLVIVAPTGSAAALLGGSTYHYMFGIDSDGQWSTGAQLAQIKSRLQGVDYVFLDEVSMLSCRDMYKISERLATINNNAESPFRGLNMIFAGDFAQLPPPIGKEHAALYSRTVGMNAVLQDQESAMGKALWHQVTTMVIL